LLGLVLHPELDDVALWRCEVRSNLGVTSTCGSCCTSNFCYRPGSASPPKYKVLSLGLTIAFTFA
jgi:hypothetical protein